MDKGLTSPIWDPRGSEPSVWDRIDPGTPYGCIGTCEESLGNVRCLMELSMEDDTLGSSYLMVLSFHVRKNQIAF